jgi:hypothetical protein
MLQAKISLDEGKKCAQYPRMTYAKHIIDQFGGYKALAAEIGKPVSTVKSWSERGIIPDWSKPAVLAAAEKLGLPVTKADFFPDEAP